MSKFSGQQYRGAARVIKELKREEAEARQKESNKRKSFDELRKIQEQLDTPLTKVLDSEDIERVIEEMRQNEGKVQAGVNVDKLIKNDNPGPALPGLAKRARKITRKGN